MDNQKKMKTLNTSYKTHSISTTNDAAIFKLDNDCMRHIFSYLNIPERVRIQRVCKTWQLLGKLPWTDTKHLVVGNKKFGFFNSVPIKDSIHTLPILKQVLGLCGSSLTAVIIRVFDQENVAVGILTLIHEYCPNLSELHMSGIKITRKVIEYLSCHYNELKHIVIGRCDSHYEDGLLQYFQLNSKLCSVTLRRFNYMTGSCLQGLPDTIEKIKFDVCVGLLFKYVLNGIKKWKHLRYLSFCDNIYFILRIDELLHALPNKLSLEELHLLTHTYDSELLQQMNNLHHFTNLKVIYFTGNTVLCDQILMELGKHCVHITHAFLYGSNRITDMGMQNFVKDLNLEFIAVYKLQGLSDKFLNSLLKSSLKIIRCGWVPVTNESLRSLMQTCENLELLDVSGCKNVDTDRLVNDVLAITNLRPHNKILRLVEYGAAGQLDDAKDQIISPRLIIKKKITEILFQFK